MMRQNVRIALYVPVALAFPMLTVLVLRAVLVPEGPVWLIIAYAALLQTTYAASAAGTGRRVLRSIRRIRLILLAVGGIAVLTNIIIVPQSAYITWFHIVANGNARGLVSFVFIVVAGYVAAVLGGQIFRHGFLLPFIGLIILGAVLGTIITQSRYFVAAVLIAGATGVFVLGGKGLSWGHRIRYGLGLSVFALAVFGASTAAASIFRSQGNNLVDTVLAPGLRDALLNVAPGFPLLYAIPGYGYSFDALPLGSSPTLSDTKIFRVHAPPGQTIYLQTAAYDSYQDGNWTDSPEILDHARKNATHAMEKLFAPGLEHPEGNDISVTILGDFYSYIPVIPDLRSLGIDLSADRSRTTGGTSAVAARQALDLEYGAMNTGYLLKSPLLKGDTIVLRRGMYDATPEPGVPEDVYLQVPDSVPAEVRSAARSLGPRIDVPFKSEFEPGKKSADKGEILSRANAIREFIQARTRYSLQTRRPPVGTDLVDYFLFQHPTGYCVHYATAFTILARLEGIPTRYVTGFLVNMPFNSSSREVSGLTAHAWPEIWLPGQGWTTFEVTPPLQASRYDDPGYYRNLGSNALTSRQLRALIGDRLPNLQETESRASNAAPGRQSWLSAVASVVALLVLVLAILSRLRRYLGRPGDQFRYACVLICARTERFGVDPPTARGWTGWSTEAAGRIVLRRSGRRRQGRGERRVAGSAHARSDAQVFTRIARVAHRSFFGGIAVSRRDARFARMLLRSLPGGLLRGRGRTQTPRHGSVT